MQTLPTLIFRVPQFSFSTNLEDCWHELKESIAQSSPSFYAIIRNIKYEEIKTLSDSVQHTIWKYFNRASYRATPYGGFAGIGTIELSKGSARPPVITKNQELKRFVDWTCTNRLAINFADLLKADALLFANSTYYLTEFDIRYVGRFDGQYELIDTTKSELKLKILKLCKTPQSISMVTSMIPESANEASFLQVLETMVADQLLISEMQPNIIGADYFQRVQLTLPVQEVEYIIAHRPLLDGSLGQDMFRHLPDLIERLHQILPSYRSPELDQFIKAFSKKFGTKEIPIMEALDPELGIGYGAMEQSLLASELIHQLGNQPATDELMNSTFNMLLPELISGKSGTIDLEDLVCPQGLSNAPLPNSLSVLCTLGDGLIQLEHLGGCTATSLLGRFTLANDDVLQQCKQIADIEQQANPGVLFFDVAYMVGNVVDNVNRRRSIYSHQLSVLNYDTTQSPLMLTDILLSVQGNELILRSRQRNMRLVPRLASAYNYLLSDLPVFRLLCDLQHQGIHKNLYLRLRDRLPGLAYYPRLSYKNIILSPATWRINLHDVQEKGKVCSVDHLIRYLKQNRISGFARVGATDQTLCINTNNSFELGELLTLLIKQKTLYLEETIVPEQPIIKDNDQQPYTSQLLLSLYHKQTIYKPVVQRSQVRGDISNGLVLPGADWIYFEVFCHPTRSDELLTNHIQNFILANQGSVLQWFFIRYSESGHHLRIRFKLHKLKKVSAIIEAFSNLFKDKIEVGLVSDILIRIYRRETERYGAANMHLVEAHFHKDSRFVVNLLKQRFDDSEKYKLCVELAYAVYVSGVFPASMFSKLVEVTSNSFSEEHSLDPSKYKLINAAYIKFREEEAPFLSNEIEQDYEVFKKSFIDTLYQYSASERPEIFTALFHMHINRLFPTAQRIHETVIYYFLTKEFKSPKGFYKLLMYTNPRYQLN